MQLQHNSVWFVADIDLKMLVNRHEIMLAPGTLLVRQAHAQ